MAVVTPPSLYPVEPLAGDPLHVRQQGVLTAQSQQHRALPHQAGVQFRQGAQHLQPQLAAPVGQRDGPDVHLFATQGQTW